MNVPIYTADVSLKILAEKRNPNLPDVELGSVLLDNIVVKGFSIENIKKRCMSRFIKKALQEKKAHKNQTYVVDKIKLLRQHGYGIDD